MGCPCVSVILPSLNVGAYVRECLATVVAQTLREIEILCVDAGSSDGTVEILEAFAREDARVRILHSPKRSYGAQVNAGLDVAVGDYVGIVETDDLVAPEMFGRLHQVAVAQDCDLVKADYLCFWGKWGRHPRIQQKFVCQDSACYGTLLDVRTDSRAICFSPIVTGIYRRRFLREAGIRFQETPGARYQDVGFYFQTHFLAKRLLFVQGSLYRYRRDRPGSSVNTQDHPFAVLGELAFAGRRLREAGAPEALRPLFGREAFYACWSAYKRVRQEDKLPLWERASRFLLGLFEEDRRFAELLSRPDQVCLRAILLSPRLFLATSDPAWVRWLRRRVAAVPLPPLVVSLTTYGRRVRTVHLVIARMLGQTLPPDRVVLWVARSEFPGMASLPDRLRAIDDPRFEVRFVEDLNSHKKYFYALQAFPEAIVVTVDDDIDYPEMLLAGLVASYRRHPYAVSCARAHTVGVQADGMYRPYADWMGTARIFNRPTMLAMPTSGAGLLYPPGCLPAEAFDIAAIRATCPTADDLWVKWWLLEAGVPCVHLPRLWRPRYLPGTQEESLYAHNRGNGEGLAPNDVAWARILAFRRPRSETLSCLLAGEMGAERRLGGPWAVRKFYGLIDCLAENGLRYTIRHAAGKLASLFRGRR